MDRFCSVVRIVCVLIVASGLSALSIAGPLDPPPGPIGSTGKTLTDVEPRIAINALNTPGDATALYVISQPGSYYLTGTVNGVAGKGGIRIDASGVTVDLCGFPMVGAPDTTSGISAAAGVSTLVVRNGIVMSWAAAGINFSTVSGATIEGVVAHGNQSSGIIGGSQCTIRACTGSLNGDSGLVAYSGTIEECSAVDNSSFGITVLSAALIRACYARNNGASGINCTGGMVVDCTSNANGTFGINCGSNSTVERCVASGNGAHGFVAGTRSRVIGNTSTGNGVKDPAGAGIQIVGSGDSRIEGNLCVGNGRGVNIGSVGNIVMRNVCTGNATNWEIAVGNALAPIVNASTNALPVNGNTYTGSLGSTDPNANYTY